MYRQKKIEVDPQVDPIVKPLVASMVERLGNDITQILQHVIGDFRMASTLRDLSNDIL